MSRNHHIRSDTTTTAVDHDNNNDNDHIPFHRPTNVSVTHPNDNSHRRQYVPSVSFSSPSWWSFVWHQTIECWVHQILYHRHIYPRVTFTSQPPPPLTTTAPRPKDFDFWNYDNLVVADSSYCVWNQHPKVQSYVARTLRTIVPSFVSGRANEVQLHVIQYYSNDDDDDDDNPAPPPGPTTTTHPPPFHILETYTIRMTRHWDDTPNSAHDGSNRNILPHSTPPTNMEAIQQRMIEGMRQLIQAHIRTLEHQHRHHRRNDNDDSNPNRSFQLALHVPPTTQSNDGDEIHQALASGTWSRISSSSDNRSGYHPTTHPPRKTIRPIYSYNEDQYIGIHVQCSMLHYSTATTTT